MLARDLGAWTLRKMGNSPGVCLASLVLDTSDCGVKTYAFQERLLTKTKPTVVRVDRTAMIHSLITTSPTSLPE